MRATVLAALATALGLAAAPGALAAGGDLTRYVNPLAGTASAGPDFGTGGGAGNTFPGATVPFGMVQWSPDTFPSSANVSGGYTYSDRRLRGFSLTHVSGAGCRVYRDLPFLPTTVPVSRPPSPFGSGDVDPAYRPSFGHFHETARPGYYGVRLDPGTSRAIDVDLTATARTGIGRFTFPRSATASVLINAGGSATPNDAADLEIAPSEQEVTGSVSSGLFCYQRNRYRVYFAARFDRPFAAFGTWQRQTIAPGSTAVYEHADQPFGSMASPGAAGSLPGSAAQAGAYLSFDPAAGRVVGVRVGLSFTSVQSARANLRAESESLPFGEARAAASAAWNDALGRVRVSGGSAASTRTFYTMLYHALLHPNVFSDADGRYRGMDGHVHSSGGHVKYANFSGWDVYRTQIPLLALIEPGRTADIVRSLLADRRESGWLPKWPVANGHTDVMVGDPADPIIASAHALGVRGFDAREALAAMVWGATHSGRSANAAYVERQGLAGYLRHGYVPHDGTHGSNGGSTSIAGSAGAVWGSAATTLEYALADFAISRLAAALGNRATAHRFLRRSANWHRLLNPRRRELEPRLANGRFLPSYSATGGEGFVEGDAAQYSWAVPWNAAGLIGALGGRKRAVDRLNRHFAQLNAGPSSAHAFLANEPGLDVPWLYNWLRAPYRTQAVVRRALLSLYGSGPAGLPGNDDLGTLSAWYVLAALGLYPAIPGTGILALDSPLFHVARVRLRGGELRIIGRGAADHRPYVRSLSLNGRRYPRPWVPFAAISRGGRLDFRLAATPDRSWGAAARAAPPSFAPGARGASPRG